jgi:hypothetical protein
MGKVYIVYGHLAYITAIKYILWPLNTFYGHLEYIFGHLIHFMAIWNILWSLWYIFPILVCCSVKNLATLATIHLRVIVVRV